jgi:exonuclease III
VHGQRRQPHRLIVAGDWNLLHGYGEVGDEYWKARYDTVFERAEALGLRFVGPQYPNGRQADPWPDELPSDSLCVPTFHHSRQTPATANRQLDFVFASRSIADRVEVCALNAPEAWGPSDHCRVVIEARL